MVTVFISYSHHDLVDARAIHKAVDEAGVGCWRDEKWLRPGNDFAAEITGAIRRCDAFILLLSEKSNSSDFVSKEVAIAYHFHKPIIPVLLEAVQPSDALLPYVVRLHYFDLTHNTVASLITDLLENWQPATEAPETPEPSHFESPIKEAPLSPSFVSNAEYLRFVQSTGHRAPLHWEPRNPRFSAVMGDDPVTWVSWDDAIAYCDWAGGCLPGPDPESQQVDTNLPSRFLEWRDAGSERHKHVYDPESSRLAAVMDHTASVDNISFRCIPVNPLPHLGWVAIPGGVYRIGTDIQQFKQVAAAHRLPDTFCKPILGRPLQRLEVPPFAISKTCVTNEAFYQFTQQTGTRWPDHWNNKWLNYSGRPFPSRLAVLPVVNIKADVAQKYCAWSRTRLPYWYEWERAAAGPERYPYPWGTDYSAAYCNSVESGRGSLAPVNEYASGSSYEGVQQLCGNVAEWAVGPGGHFEMRGGSYRVPCELWGLSYAFSQPGIGYFASDVGFRVVRLF